MIIIRDVICKQPKNFQKRKFFDKIIKNICSHMSCMKMQRTNESWPEPDAEEKTLRRLLRQTCNNKLFPESLPLTGLRQVSMKPG